MVVAVVAVAEVITNHLKIIKTKISQIRVATPDGPPPAMKTHLQVMPASTIIRTDEKLFIVLIP